MGNQNSSQPHQEDQQHLSTFIDHQQSLRSQASEGTETSRVYQITHDDSACQPQERTRAPLASPIYKEKKRRSRVHRMVNNSSQVSWEKTSATGSSQWTSERSDMSDGPIPSLHGSLMRTQVKRDPLRFYEVVKIIGQGSIGSVSKVQKRSSALGGSARSDFVSMERRHKCCFGFGLSFFPSKRDVFDETDMDKNTPKEKVTASTRQQKYKTKKSTSSMISYGHKELIFALKTIHMDKVSDPTLKLEMMNEIAILQNLDHPNIVKAIETFDYSNQMFLLLELCNGGDLYARDPYTEEQAHEIVHSILDAIGYMHSRGITHRDLKYENIMFASPTSNAVKIIDFGLSKKYAPQQHMHDTVGTVYTMAPEVFLGDYDQKVDIWSIGVIAFMLLSSSLPFYGKTRQHVMKRIMSNTFSFKGGRWKKVSSVAMYFIEQLLVLDPKKRPSTEQALKLSWFEAAFDEKGHASEVELDRVQAAMQVFAKHGRLKKLALLVIAYKSTDDEIGFLRKVFRKFDNFENGEISLEEFKLALVDYEYTEEEAEKMFVALDLDRTGSIHYSEFLAATIEAHGSIDEERIAEAFDRLDCDDSGYITIDNLKDFLGGTISQEYLDAIIDEADITRDHRISYEEFLSMWDQEEDKKLETAIAMVGRRRFDSQNSEISATNSSLSDDMDMSRVSATSTELGGGTFFFGKEREKSIRGVWV